MTRLAQSSIKPVFPTLTGIDVAIRNLLEWTF
jgi:hypothetical protein